MSSSISSFKDSLSSLRKKRNFAKGILLTIIMFFLFTIAAFLFTGESCYEINLNNITNHTKFNRNIDKSIFKSILLICADYIREAKSNKEQVKINLIFLNSVLNKYMKILQNIVAPIVFVFLLVLQVFLYFEKDVDVASPASIPSNK